VKTVLGWFRSMRVRSQQRRADKAYKEMMKLLDELRESITRDAFMNAINSEELNRFYRKAK
jgi:histone H3/H4